MNGLSATIFEEVSTGARHLAIRGTQDPADLLTDIIDIFVLGTAEYQLQYASLKSQVETWMMDGDLTPGFTVAGHSLGGFLAGALKVDMPHLIEHAYLYNAPGVGGVAIEVALLRGLESLWGVDVLPSLDLTGVTNIRAQAGISPIAGLGTAWNTPTPIVIEDQFFSDVADPPAAYNHSQQVLTDALAVYALLGELSDSTRVAALGDILLGSSERNAWTLESVVNDLGDLFQAGTEITGMETDVRDAVYARIHALSDSAAYQAALQSADASELSVLVGRRGSQLVDLAREDIGYRYALRQLDAFALTGDAALYQPHNAAGELELYEASSRHGSLTEAWLADRAHMLAHRLARNWADGPTSTDAESGLFQDLALDVQFLVNGESSEPARHYLFGAAAADALSGAAGHDRLYGGAGDDTLSGDTGDDYLEGNQGDDRLDGGPGDDRLVGGRGLDIYLYAGGSGRDTVYDSDGRGEIRIDGVTLTGGSRLGDGVWRSTDGRHTYAVDGDAQNGASLWIDGVLRVEDFRDGDLGIVLGEPELAEPPSLVLNGASGHDPLWYGDVVEDYRNQDAIDVRAEGGAGNDLISTANGADLISGGAGNDWVISGGGMDSLDGGAGDDALFPGLGGARVEAGPGNDLVIAGQVRVFDSGGSEFWDGIIWRDIGWGYGIQIDPEIGLNADGEVDFQYTVTMPTTPQFGTSAYGANWSFDYRPTSSTQGTISYRQDGGSEPQSFSIGQTYYAVPDDSPYWLLGGDGNDALGGNHGDDTLHGGAGADVLGGGAGNDRLLGGAGANILLGQHGEDLIQGGADADRAFGGSGRDRIHGGGGDDELSGDNGAAAVGDADRIYGEAGDDRLAGNGGDDWIEGGTGHDTLWGEDGEDTLIGGVGLDRLSGGDGADALRGDADDDTLYGDAGSDRLEGGSGGDWLYGGAGADQLIGGSGDDQLIGGAGEDVYAFAIGDGVDVVVGAGDDDRVRIGVGSGALRLSQFQADDGGRNLTIGYGEQGDAIIVRDAFAAAIGSVATPSQGERPLRDVLSGLGESLNLTGSAAAETLLGAAAADVLAAGDGADFIYANAGDDSLSGGAGDDRLEGEAGADLLHGGAGDDVLIGGAGEDRYRLHWGMGQDRIVEDGSELSILLLDSGLNLSDLRTQVEGDDWLVALPGGQDVVRLTGAALTLDQWRLQAGDGSPIRLDELSQPVGLEAAMTDFEARVRGQYIATALGHGSLAQAEGRFQRVVTEAYNIGGYNAEFRTHRVTEQYATQTFLSDETLINRTTPSYEWQRDETGRATVEHAATTADFGAVGGLAAGSFHNVDAFSRTPMPSGGGLIEVYAEGLDLGAEPVLRGYWLYESGHAPTDITYESVAQVDYRTDATLTFERIAAGVSSNTIHTSGNSSVDGGAGNDRITAAYTAMDHWERINANGTTGGFTFSSHPFRYDGPYVEHDYGAFLYGNTGDDLLLGSAVNDILVGGDGVDVLDGAGGQDIYYVAIDMNGEDVIADSGGLPVSMELGDRYTDWYYQSIGLSNWQSVHHSLRPSVPGLAPNDYDALAPLHAAGVVPMDTVEFGPSIEPAMLRLSWGEYAPQALVDAAGQGSTWDDAGYAHATLDIGWGTAARVRLVIPHTQSMASADADAMPGMGSGELPPGAGFPPGDGGGPPAAGDEGLLPTARIGQGIERVRFADGSLMSIQQLLALAPPAPSWDPQAEDNVLIGTAFDDALYGGAGADSFTGGAGRDRLVGGAGDDSYHIDRDDQVVETADGGLDTLYANFTLHLPVHVENLVMTGQANQYGYGNDLNNRLVGNAGDNGLGGGWGDDVLLGLAGDDLLHGGRGNDRMWGGPGDDRYFVHETGDQVIEYADEGHDRIWSLVDYQLPDHVEDLWLFYPANNGVGNDLANRIYAGGLANELRGGAGDDLLQTAAGDDLLWGETGNDTLRAGTGDDQLMGGPGDDLLSGERGSDLYRFTRGDGRDRIDDYSYYDAHPDRYGLASDRILWEGDIAHDQLWFSRTGVDLRIQVIGTQDEVRVQDWYRGAAYRVETLQTGDAYRLQQDQVEQLVQAMAAFDAPASGEFTLPESYRMELEPVLAANWQAA